MKKLLAIALLGLGLAFGLSACKKSETATVVDKPDLKNYPITGVVLELREKGKLVILKHEAIPGLMEAMSMGFEVADPALTKDLKKGDKVEGNLAVGPNHYMITTLKKR